MNILVLEDRGEVSFYLREFLESEGHVVLEAYNPNDAQSHWNVRKKVSVDCIIADLNMPPDGLTDEETASSRNGLLSGWYWLSGRVFPECPEMRKRVIVYSDYLADFKRYVRSEEYAGIRLVAKRGSSSPAEAILNHLREIAWLAR